jgi:hypothetical protein
VAAVGLATLVLAGCGAESRPEADGAAGSRPAACQDDLGLVPATHREDGQVALPLVFVDGTTAELVYPLELDIACLGVFPYGSGRLQGKSRTAGRGDAVARDFWIRLGELEDILALRNGGKPPALRARYEGADGTDIGLWDLRTETADYLGFQFGRWAVLVYDYVDAAAMTDAERASWAASFSGRETADGFLLLEGKGPLRLARAGEHAGPQLTFAAGEPTRDLTLYPGRCQPHPNQTLVVGGKRVELSGSFADWCLSDSLRIHASGSREFIRTLIHGLAARNVRIAGK